MLAIHSFACPASFLKLVVLCALCVCVLLIRLHRFLKLSFFSVSDLMDVRGVLLPIIQANGRRQEMQVSPHTSRQ